MKNLPLLIGTLVVTLGLVVGVVFIFSRQGVSQSQPVDPAQLVTEQSHARGPDSAVVTIVEFSDFQCPACRATQSTIKQVLGVYPEQVRLVYRHFPLTSIHPNAQLAAQASEVAAEEGKFWEYHDLLFDRQAIWSELESKQAFIEQLADYAEELGIDKPSFLERIDSDHIKSLVTADAVAGNQLNIQATPTLFVNGRHSPATQLQNQVESVINNLE